MFISDQHKGIKKAIQIMYPDAPYGLCVFHMTMNVKNTFKRDDVAGIFKHAYKIYRESEFNEEMSELMWVHLKKPSLVKAYAGVIRPVGHMSGWEIPDEISTLIVHPPLWISQAGRPCKIRKPSIEEFHSQKAKTCSLCKQSGYNRQNCPKLLGLSPPITTVNLNLVLHRDNVSVGFTENEDITDRHAHKVRRAA
ncbi:hypothetical protein QYF36_012803 [Acer negundo]|nr:hypothetical protein QYF36_012803 [Acer negundo]